MMRAAAVPEASALSQVLSVQGRKIKAFFAVRYIYAPQYTACSCIDPNGGYAGVW
jgi:hypothetical protein